jgi:hypothetical protein
MLLRILGCGLRCMFRSRLDIVRWDLGILHLLKGKVAGDLRQCLSNFGLGAWKRETCLLIGSC